MDIKTAIQLAGSGEAMLFLGAGFSMGTRNLNGVSFASSKKLSETVSGAVGLPLDTPLTLASDIYRESKGTDELIALIKPNFTASTPVPEPHVTIAAMPWRRVYTTNYDDLFEKASEASGKHVFSATLSDRVRDIPKKSITCVHLNGYVGKLDRSSIDTELKLTDSSYLHGTILDSEWTILLRQDLRLAKAVIFIGYSLYDYEIRKLLVDIPMLKEKALFVLGPTPNLVLVQQIQQYGSAASKSTTEFGEIIANTKLEKIESIPNSYLTLHEFKVPHQSIKPTDGDQWNLFLLGAIKGECLNYSIAAGSKYLISRNRATECAEIFKEKQVIALLGELGNGKSALLESLQFELAAQGYRVFWIRESGEEAEKELAQIAVEDGKKVFILESYPDRLNLVRTFAMHSNDCCRMIVTARTSVHDIFSYDLREELSGADFAEIRLDLLNDVELNAFSDLFTEFGMWGDRAGDSDRRKFNFLDRECGRQVHGILIRLLESPQIQNRLVELLSPLSDKQEHRDVLVCIMIVTMLGKILTTDTLADLVGSEALSGRDFRADPQVRQLVGFDSYRVNVRSPVVAEFYLTRLSDKTVTLSVLTRLAERTNKGRDASRYFWSLFASLQRFSLIQRLFPLEGKLAVVTAYYEAIKSLDGCVKNYHFWLQYAIACLTLGERERSKRYFDQAYAISRERGEDAYKVDNHYSRYLLESAVEYSEAKDAMECFRYARDIISRQIKDERFHYPYRVALLYERFINRFGTNLNESWIDEVDQAARAVLDRIPQLPEERRNNRYVRQCASILPYVLYKCDDLKRRLSDKNTPSSSALEKIVESH